MRDNDPEVRHYSTEALKYLEHYKFTPGAPSPKPPSLTVVSSPHADRTATADKITTNLNHLALGPVSLDISTPQNAH